MTSRGIFVWLRYFSTIFAFIENRDRTSWIESNDDGNQRTMTDDRLQQLLSNVPEESIILLEDIDAATVGWHYEQEGSFSLLWEIDWRMFVAWNRCGEISRNETIDTQWIIEFARWRELRRRSNHLYDHEFHRTVRRTFLSPS